MDQRLRPTAASGSTFDLDTLFAFNRHTLEAFTDLANHTMDRSAAFNAAWVNLVQKRIEQNMTVPQRLASCRSPEEVMKLYADWAQVAAAQYQQGFEAMARIGQEYQRDAVEAVSETLNGASHGLGRRAA